MNFIELLIVGSLFTWGVYKALQPGQILGALGDILAKHEGKYWVKPLGLCVPCMSSVYGTIIFWSFYLLGIYTNDLILIYYICFIFSLTGLNYFMLCLIPD